MTSHTHSRTALLPLTHTHTLTRKGNSKRSEGKKPQKKEQRTEGSERSNVCSYFATNALRWEEQRLSEDRFSGSVSRSLALSPGPVLIARFFNSLTQFESRLAAGCCCCYCCCTGEFTPKRLHGNLNTCRAAELVGWYGWWMVGGWVVVAGHPKATPVGSTSQTLWRSLNFMISYAAHSPNRTHRQTSFPVQLEKKSFRQQLSIRKTKEFAGGNCTF